MTMRPPGRVTRTISLATSNGRGANIAPKIDTTRSNRSSARSVSARRVALLEPEVVEAFVGGALVPGLDEVAGDVDAEHVGAAARRGDRGGAVAAAEVEHLESLGDAEPIDERLAAACACSPRCA